MCQSRSRLLSEADVGQDTARLANAAAKDGRDVLLAGLRFRTSLIQTQVAELAGQGIRDKPDPSLWQRRGKSRNVSWDRVEERGSGSLTGCLCRNEVIFVVIATDASFAAVKSTFGPLRLATC